MSTPLTTLEERALARRLARACVAAFARNALEAGGFPLDPRDPRAERVSTEIDRVLARLTRDAGDEAEPGGEYMVVQRILEEFRAAGAAREGGSP